MRIIFAVTVLLALNANNGADGFLGPVAGLLGPLISPVLETLEPITCQLPIDLGNLLESLGVCANARPDPELEAEVERYQRGDRQACCQADHFPKLFTAFTKVNACLKNAFADAGITICNLLKALQPITGCSGGEGKAGREGNAGCLLQGLLGPIFGQVGSALATIIVDVLEPLNPIDGCLTSGSTQMYHRIVYGGYHKGANYGDSQTPVGALAGAALGGVFAISRCLPEPMASLSLGAWTKGVQMVSDRCEAQIRKGFWKKQW